MEDRPMTIWAVVGPVYLVSAIILFGFYFWEEWMYPNCRQCTKTLARRRTVFSQIADCPTHGSFSLR